MYDKVYYIIHKDIYIYIGRGEEYAAGVSEAVSPLSDVQTAPELRCLLSAV